MFVLGAPEAKEELLSLVNVPLPPVVIELSPLDPLMFPTVPLKLAFPCV